MPAARSRPRTVPVRIRARRDIDLGLCCCHAAAPGVRRDTSPDPRWSPNTHTGSGFSCGYYMIRVDILDSSPIFTRGLEQILTAEGIRVMGNRTSSSQEGAWFVDVLNVELAAHVISGEVG